MIAQQAGAGGGLVKIDDVMLESGLRLLFIAIVPEGMFMTRLPSEDVAVIVFCITP